MNPPFQEVDSVSILNSPYQKVYSERNYNLDNLT